MHYTTIQLNRNYAAKMHVDGNNHDPLPIIALGNYTGDELCDADGAKRVAVGCRLLAAGRWLLAAGRWLLAAGC